MSTVARKFASVPHRSSRDTWTEIVNLLAPDSSSDSHEELHRVTGIASSLLARELMESAPVVVFGGPGPRVKVFCVYGTDAIGGDGVNETALATVPTQGDWKVSLPCSVDDLSWVRDALKVESSRITARDVTTLVPDQTEEEGALKATIEELVNLEAFLKR